MANIAQPLSVNFPIVDPKTGAPTEAFIMWAQQFGGAAASTSDIATLQDQVNGLQQEIADLEFGDLADVDMTTTPPTNGQVPVWDDGDLLWKPGSAAGGGGEWQLIATYDPAVDGVTGEIVVTDLGSYSELSVITHNLSSAPTSFPAAVYFSTDNGATFDGTNGHYNTFNINGVVTNDTSNVWLHASNQTVHQGSITICGNIPGSPKFGDCVNSQYRYIYTGSLDVIDAIKIKTRFAVPVDFVSGKAYIWGK